MARLTHVRFFQDAIEKEEMLLQRSIHLKNPRLRSDLGSATDPSRSGSSLGEERLAALRDVLENGYTWTRSNTQRRFHESFLNACVRFLFSQDSSPPDYRDILDRNNWEDIRQQCLCMTPRRFGKTVAVGMFVGAIALVVPGSEQAIFSTGRRASNKLLELVSQLVSQVPGGSERIVKSNQETVWVSHPCGSTSKINSYPSCAKTLRGVGGDIVYMEEASFMDLAVFYEVIVPLLEVDRTALICISTPQVRAAHVPFSPPLTPCADTFHICVLCLLCKQDSLNFYSEMFQMKGPDGKELFRNIQVGLACAECVAAGKADSCEHNQDEIPPWKSREKFDLVKALYGDRKDLLMRESMGVVTEDQSSLFRAQWVDAFMDGVVMTPDPHFILVACDPNGGGDSHMAIVSATFLHGSMVVVGLDSHPVRGHDEIEILLMAHMKSLQKRYQNSWFVFVGESNLGQEADHMRYMLRNEGHVYCVTEGGLAGVRTTSKRKELYAMELCKFMSQSAMKHTGSHLVVENPLNTESKPLESLKQQLMGFRKIILQSKTGRSEARVSYTGKSQGAQDDLVITASIAAYWGVQFMTQRIQSVPYDQFNERPVEQR